MTGDAYIKAGFGERAYHNATNVHALGIAALFVACVWAMSSRRSTALRPMLALATFVPTGQRIAIATLDFNLIRLLLLAYVARVLVRREWTSVRWTKVDSAVMAWCGLGFLGYVIRRGDLSGLIYKSGATYDALGLYWVCRVYIRNLADVRRTVAFLGFLGITISFFFLLEKTTGRNAFSMFGGVPEFTKVREGRLRCQGAYEHPILAGTNWSALLPLFLTALPSTRLRIGATAATLAIVIACASSTPLLGVAAGICLWALYPARRFSPQAIAAAVAAGFVIHFAREAPVWQLIAKASIVGGSTGYHRYALVNAFILRWQEWFVVGTSSTAHWGYFLFDLANQYVKEGVVGGFAAFAAFLSALGLGFSQLWKASLSFRGTSLDRRTAWGLVAALGAFSVMFIGISITHSNQVMLTFMFLLSSAATASLHSSRRRPRNGNRSSDSSAEAVHSIGHGPTDKRASTPVSPRTGESIGNHIADLG